MGVAEGVWGTWKHPLPVSRQGLRVYLALLLLGRAPRCFCIAHKGVARAGVIMGLATLEPRLLAFQSPLGS